jgi:xyloglucan-specific exo-beta-1,4-glucanase
MKLVRHFALLLMSAPLFAQLNIVTDNKYGMIEDIQYDGYVQDKLYARTVGNHILSSENGGANWQYLYGDLDGNVHSVKYDKENNLLTFANQLNRHIEVKFFDLNTNSVSKVISVPTFPYSTSERIQSYKFFPNDYNQLLVHKVYFIGPIFYNQYYLTRDGGTTWTHFYEENEESNYIPPSDFNFDHTNPDRIFLSFSYDYREANIKKVGLYYSDDDGQSYNSILDEDYIGHIFVSPHNPSEIWLTPYYLFEDVSTGILKSTDAGQTWSTVNVDFNTGHEPVMDLYFNEHDPNHIIITEANEIAVSIDGGNSFQITEYTNEDWENDYYYGSRVSVNPFNKNEYYLRSDYFSVKTTDNGETFSRVNVPFSITRNVMFNKIDGEDILVYGTSFGYIHKNLTTSTTLERDILPLNMHTINDYTQFRKDLHQKGKMYIYRGWASGRTLNVSEDNGITYQEVFQSMIQRWTMAYSNPLFPKTVWTSQSTDTYTELAKVDYSNMNNIQVEYLNVPSGNSIWAMQINPANTQEIMIAFGEIVLKSLDNGNTWNMAMNGIPNVENFHKIGDIVQNPHNEQEFYLTASYGIYKTTDFGENWTLVYDQPSFTLHASPLHDGRMIMVSHFNQGFSKMEIHYTNNGGIDWDIISTESLFNLFNGDDIKSADVYFEGDEAHVYISTADSGVVKYIVNLPELSVSDPIFLNQDHLVIYPNPAKESINISSQTAIEKVEIYSVTGQKVMDSTSAKINVQHLAQGVYIVRAQLKNGKVQTQKFIKK